MNLTTSDLLKRKEQLKKTLEKSEEKLKQALELNKDCVEKFVKKMAGNKTTLQTIYNEVQKQINVMNTLFVSLGEKNKNILENIEKSKNHSSELLLELNIIFGKLKEIPLQNELTLISKSMENTIDKKDLFDFVNVESVEVLKLQAQEELLELDKLKILSKDALQDITIPYQHIIEKSKQLFLKIDSISFNYNSETFNQKELEDVKTLVLEVASKYDKLQFITTNDSDISKIDTNEFKDIDEFSDKIQQLINKKIEKIVDNCSKSEEKFHYFTSFYKNLREIFEELRHISPLIPNKLVQIEGIESVYLQRTSASRNIFEEISDLTTWYNLFLISYKQLLLEIHRRTTATQKIDKFVSDVSKQLQDIYSNEIRLREEFQTNFGSYLPPTLCPPIFEYPTKFSITPEKVKSNLPSVILSNEEIEDIKKNYSLEEKSEEN